MSADKTINVLFLCNHNTARSLMAEAMLNHLGKGNIKAYSAASHFIEHETPNPLALQVLAESGIDVSQLNSKCWLEFEKPDAPHMDIVITLCDDALGEPDPLWHGQPATAHWDYADPNLVKGSDTEKYDAFSHTMRLLHNHLVLFVNLPHAALDRMALEYEARMLVGHS